jgi:hypothetical protein
VVVLGLLVASCSRDQPQARTYYESLDLSSPEAAVMRFVTVNGHFDVLAGGHRRSSLVAN